MTKANDMIERDALKARAEKAEADLLEMAQKFDEGHANPALMARIIMKHIEDELRVKNLEAERDALWAALQDIAADFSRPERGLTDFGERQHYLHIACRLRDKARSAIKHSSAPGGSMGCVGNVKP